MSKKPLSRLVRCSKAFFAFFRIVRSFYALLVHFSTFFALGELVIQSGKGVRSVNSFAAISHFFLYNDDMFQLRSQVEISQLRRKTCIAICLTLYYNVKERW